MSYSAACIEVPENCRNYRGYGVICRRVDGKGKQFRLNRLVYEWYYQTSILPGNIVMHTCDNPPCVNPDHLREATPAENMKDMVAKGRSASGDRSGRRQHPGSYEGRYKLDENLVRDIRRELAAGRTQRAIADDFGLAHQTISDIKHGRIWGHVID